MDEAQIIVEFETPDENFTWRTFSIQVGPDDTRATIANRVGELVEDYLETGLGFGYVPSGLEPVVTSMGLEFEILTWPEFD